MTAKAVSIRGQLARALAVWALLWCVALGLAVWLQVSQEVDELLDDSLQSVAEGLIAPLVAQQLTASPPVPGSAPGDGRRFVWQVVEGTQVLVSAAGSPAAPLQTTPTPGFSDRPGWRIFGLALGRDGRMLYVAQSREERLEVQLELGFAVLLAAVPVALLQILWLNWRVRRDLQPLQDLSLRLAHYDPLQPGATLGPAAYEELQPVQAAIDALAARLAQRVARERDFTAHAAHALRTPLAGIDAQLAVALREAHEPLHGRLQRVRAAAVRLQHVVQALLALFRSGAEVQRQPIVLANLVARLPMDPKLTPTVSATQPLHADEDLLTAALLNLADNAMGHGATGLHFSTPAPGVLRIADDGVGIDAPRRQTLQAALDAEDYAGRTGLGLMLAGLVARAHGGRVDLPPLERGFAIELRLEPPTPQRNPAQLA